MNLSCNAVASALIRAGSVGDLVKHQWTALSCIIKASMLTVWSIVYALLLTAAVWLQENPWLFQSPSWWQRPYLAQLCFGSVLVTALVPPLACTHRYVCHVMIWASISTCTNAEAKTRSACAKCDVNTLVMLPWAFVDAASFLIAATRFALGFQLASDPWRLFAIFKVVQQPIVCMTCFQCIVLLLNHKLTLKQLPEMVSSHQCVMQWVNVFSFNLL